MRGAKYYFGIPIQVMQRQAEGGVHAGDQQRLPGRARSASTTRSSRWAPPTDARRTRDSGARLMARGSSSIAPASAMPTSEPRRVTTALRQPWGAIVAFLLPALTLYVALHRLSGRAHVLEQLPQACCRGARSFVGLANYAELAARRHLLARGAQHHHLGLHLAAGRGVGRAAAGPRALRQGPGRALLPRRLVHAGADVLRRGRHPLAVDLQLRLGRR